jgi:hypothetical protein
MAPRRRRRKRGRGSTDLSDARRALNALEGEEGPPADYVVTDIRTLPLGVRRERRIVYLQQRFMGLPVYDGRRSVAFAARREDRQPAPVRSVSKLVPATTAEASVAAAFGHVFEGSCPTLEAVGSFASVERFTAFQGDGLSVATTHLSVFGAGRAQLAWVVDLAPVGGPRFEIVLDAGTLGCCGGASRGPPRPASPAPGTASSDAVRSGGKTGASR